MLARLERRIFIGDIQGCREELEQLLEAVRYDPGTDVLQPVGDLVNRGPDSLGTLRLLRELDAEGVLGNHDLHLLAASSGKREPQRRDTLDEVLAADDRGELLDWLAARPFVRVWDDLYLVHAGLHPRWSDPAAALADADPYAPDEAARFAVRVRACDAAGELAPSESEEAGGNGRFRPWFDFYDPGAHGERAVVFGHWSQRGLTVRPRLRGLDTGCVWGGQLTAWIAEEDRIVQVDAARAYARIE